MTKFHFFCFTAQCQVQVFDGLNKYQILVNSLLIKSLIILIAYFPVAAGSPGPLDKKIPSGLRVKILSAEVLHEITVTLQLKSEKYLKIFFFIP
jgi:hypothetical protein